MPSSINRLSFIGAALSLMVTYVTSASPIPLYGIYQSQDQLGYVELSLSSVVYFIGTVTALVLFGRLSNFMGRKPVSLLALLLSAFSLLFLFNYIVQLSCYWGAYTALASWLVDHAAGCRRR